MINKTNKLLLFIINLIIIFLLSGCSNIPDVNSVDNIEEDIIENDPVYSYFNSKMDETTIEKRKIDEKEGVDSVWVNTETKYDYFTYKCSYKLQYSLYNTDNGNSWILDDVIIDNESMRFIPTYNYSGSWATMDQSPLVIGLNNMDWEKGEFYYEPNGETEKLTYVVSEDNGNLYLEMMSEHFQFVLDANQADSEPVFKCYYNDTESIRVSSNLIQDMINTNSYNILDDTSCIEIRTKNGNIIANAIQLMDISGVIDEDSNLVSAIQLDFNYQLEEVFSPYNEQEVDIYSFGEKISSVKIEDVSPFLTIIVKNDDNIDIYDMDSFYNTLNLYLYQ